MNKLNYPNVKKIYLDFLKGRGLKESSIKRKALELKRFFEYLENTDLREIKPDEIEAYFLHLKSFSPATQSTALSLIRELFYIMENLFKTGGTMNIGFPQKTLIPMDLNEDLTPGFKYLWDKITL